MSANSAYDIVMKGISDTSEAPRAKDIFYRCLKCGDIIPSVPKGNVGCSCGNVFIDRDYFRLSVEDYSKIEVLKKIGRVRKSKES